MPTTKEAAAAAAATAATDALAGQAAVAAQQAILARQAAAAAAQRAEFTYIAGLPPNRRSVAQNTRLSVFLGTAPRTQQAGPTALHALSVAVHVLEIQRGGTVYRLNDPSDGFYVVVDGRVILYDVKDREESEEDDGMVDRLGRTDSFGEEDLLSNSRRAHRADVGSESSALLLRVPPELYRKYLQHLHQPDFEDKVEFLSQLEVFRSLPDDTLRKLAPCFSQVELRAKEYLVKQGERADSMYAIASGQCSVLVDPNYRAEGSGQAESDPKKAMQVCLIGPGNIVGDMTVLANIRKRTASILCLSDLIIYKIRRATFIRRVPSIQLEALRQVAEAKLRITERRLHSAAAGPGSGGGKNSAPVMLTLRDKILHGHDLRQLAHPPSVGPLELRCMGRASLNGGVEALLANSLAAATAASAGGNAPTSYGTVSARPHSGMGTGSSGPMAAAASVAVASMNWAGPGDARMRFSGPRRSPSLPHPSHYSQSQAHAQAMAAAGAAGQVPVDRAATAAAKARTRPTVPSGALPGGPPAERVRGPDINYTWGLGPGTMIKALLERPASANSGGAARRVEVRPSPRPGADPNGPQDGGGGAPPPSQAPGSTASASAPLPAPQPFPSPASAQLQPTSSRQQVQHLSFTYGRGGANPAGMRGSASSIALTQPRWGWTSGPTDTSYSPYNPMSTSTDAAGIFSVVGLGVVAGVSPGVGAAAAGGVAGGGGGGLGGVGSLSSRRGGLRSANMGGNASSSSAGDRLSMALEPTSRRSFSGGGQLVALPRPGPLVIGAAAPNSITQQQSPLTPQQPLHQHTLQPRHGSADFTARTNELFVDVTAQGRLFSGSEVTWSGHSSPWRPQADAAQQQDQKWGRDSAEAEGGSGGADGSDSECTSPGRGELARRQKSVGKARFSRQFITQNSSVDALVAEAIVCVMAKDVMLKQARAVEAAIMEETVVDQDGEEAEVQGIAEDASAGEGGGETLGEDVGHGEAAEEASAQGCVDEEEDSGTPEETGGELRTVEGDGTSGAVEGDGTSGAVEGDGASEAVEGDGPSGAVEGDGPSGAVEGNGPSGAVEGDGPLGAVKGDGPSGAVEGDGPLGAVEGDGPSGAIEGDGATEPVEGDGATGAVDGNTSSSIAKGDGASGTAVAEDSAARPEDDPDGATASVVAAAAGAGEASEAPGESTGPGAGSLEEPLEGGASGPRLASASPAPEASGLSEASAASRDNATSPGHSTQGSLQRQQSHGAQPPHRTSDEPDLSAPGALPPLRRLSSSHSGAAGPGFGASEAGHSQPRVGRTSGGGGAGSDGARTASGGVASGAACGGTGSGAGNRSMSRQPTTLHLVLPNNASTSFGRQSGVSPQRRQLTGPPAPRPYPYVGPFLSVNKGLHLPPNFATPLLGVAVPKQQQQLPSPTSLGLRSMSAASGAEQPSGVDTRPGPGQGTDSGSGTGSISGGGASGRGGGGSVPAAVPGGNSTIRGQLRKGGALYKPASLPRASAAAL